MRASYLAPLILALTVGCNPAPKTTSNPTPTSETIVVSAASSLTDALTEIGGRFTSENPNLHLSFNFAASGVLERQIELGAPTDIFISASTKEMQTLAAKKLLDEPSRVNLIGNTLVLIAPHESQISDWTDLTSSAVHKIAISNPETVPSGRYAKETLEHRALWQKVQPKLILGENVRQTLTYVASGDADAGIVYHSDVILGGDKIKPIATAQSGIDHQAILYPLAVLRSTNHYAAATKFAMYLTSPASMKVFSSYGFTPLSQP